MGFSLVETASQSGPRGTFRYHGASQKRQLSSYRTHTAQAPQVCAAEAIMCSISRFSCGATGSATRCTHNAPDRSTARRRGASASKGCQASRHASTGGGPRALGDVLQVVVKVCQLQLPPLLYIRARDVERPPLLEPAAACKGLASFGTGAHAACGAIPAGCHRIKFSGRFTRCKAAGPLASLQVLAAICVKSPSQTSVTQPGKAVQHHSTKMPGK